MGKQNLSGKQLQKNLTKPSVNAFENEAAELPMYLVDFKPEVQEKIMLFLGIKKAQELNLDTFPLFVLPKPEIDDQ